MRSEVTLSGDSESAGQRTSADVLAALLRREWSVHGGTIKWFLTVAFLATFVWPVVNHPGWVLAYGAVAALFLGQALGGSEVLEGSEEFAFALPVSRREYYTAKAIVGLTVLLGLAAVGTAALAGNWASALWGLVVETEFAGWHSLEAPPAVWQLCFLLPVALFAVVLAIAANAKSVRLVPFAWLLGGLLTAGLVGLGYYLEVQQLFPEGGFSSTPGAGRQLTGKFAVLALAVVAIVALAGGLERYARKTVQGSADDAGRRPVVGTISAVVVVVIVILFLLLGLALVG